MTLLRGSCVLALTAIIVTVHVAWAQTTARPNVSGESAFYEASNLLREARYAEAADAFSRLATQLPNDPFADNALGELARLYEEKLSDPKRALEIYDRILRDYPSSRVARRAAQRAAVLRQGMGPDGADVATLIEFNDIFRRYSSARLAESISRMENLLAANPTFSLAPRATHWLATQYQKDNQWEKARIAYRQVQSRWPRSAWAARATEGEGDMHLLRGDLDSAKRAFAKLEKMTDRGLAQAAWQRYTVRAWRQRIDLVSWLVVLLVTCAFVIRLRQLSGAWSEVGRVVIKPPTEVLYLLPVLALFCLAALTEHYLMTKAILVLSSAATLFVWLNGCTVALTKAKGRLTWPITLAHVAGTGLVILASVYLAVTQDQFIDQLLETVRFGPEH